MCVCLNLCLHGDNEVAVVYLQTHMLSDEHRNVICKYVSLLYIAMRLVHVADAIVTGTVVQRTTVSLCVLLVTVHLLKVPKIDAHTPRDHSRIVLSWRSRTCDLRTSAEGLCGLTGAA
jgi:hypothetical protein